MLTLIDRSSGEFLHLGILYRMDTNTFLKDVCDSIGKIETETVSLSQREGSPYRVTHERIHQDDLTDAMIERYILAHRDQWEEIMP